MNSLCYEWNIEYQTEFFEFINLTCWSKSSNLDFNGCFTSAVHTILEVLWCCLTILNVSSSCDSPEKLKAILPRLEQELKDTGKFKDFYQFTFNFAKNPGQKGLGK